MSSPTDNIRPELLEIHKKLLDFAKTGIPDAIQIETLKPNRPNQLFEIVVHALSAKSTTTYEAINLLCKEDFCADALTLTKSLIEHLITLAYITAPQQNEIKNHRAQLFTNWSNISIHNAKTLSSHFRMIPKISLDEMLKVEKSAYDESFKLHKEECDKLGKIADRNSWSGLSLSVMAKRTELSQIYVLYWVCNQFAHPNIEGLKSNVSLDYTVKDIVGAIFHSGPNPGNNINDDLVLSFITYCHIINKIDKIFHLNLDNEIEIIKSNFVNVNQGT